MDSRRIRGSIGASSRLVAMGRGLVGSSPTATSTTALGTPVPLPSIHSLGMGLSILGGNVLPIGLLSLELLPVLGVLGLVVAAIGVRVGLVLGALRVTGKVALTSTCIAPLLLANSFEVLDQSHHSCSSFGIH